MIHASKYGINRDNFSITESLQLVISNTPDKAVAVLEVFSKVITLLNNLSLSKESHESEFSKGISLNPFGWLKEIDNGISNENNEISKQFKITCGNGCAHCCDLPVSITISETQRAIDYCNKNNLIIDYDKLRKQSRIDKDDWSKVLSIYEQKCVFLDQNNSCSIYDVRPASCRKLLSVEDPEKCDKEKYPSGSVGRPVSTRNEILVSAMFHLEMTGLIPDMFIYAHNLNKK